MLDKYKILWKIVQCVMINVSMAVQCLLLIGLLLFILEGKYIWLVV